jgi:hypothetical protein
MCGTKEQKEWTEDVDRHKQCCDFEKLPGGHLEQSHWPPIFPRFPRKSHEQERLTKTTIIIGNVGVVCIPKFVY